MYLCISKKEIIITTKKQNKMKKLKKSSKFYQIALTNFRKQYKDVAELTSLQVTADNKVCGGEWIDSKGIINLGLSIDAVSSIKIVD